MSLQKLEDEILALPPAEFAALRDWIAALDADRWDAQFEADITGGKLDVLGDEAVKDFIEGRCTQI